MGRWISVNKRLPQWESYVWVLTNGEVDMAVVTRVNDTVGFNAFAVSGEAACTLKNVTHWMPIARPKPPRGGIVIYPVIQWNENGTPNLTARAMPKVEYDKWAKDCAK